VAFGVGMIRGDHFQVMIGTAVKDIEDINKISRVTGLFRIRGFVYIAEVNFWRIGRVFTRRLAARLISQTLSAT
jgi:hypothetical protein